jgi:hypothetical protein
VIASASSIRPADWGTDGGLPSGLVCANANGTAQSAAPTKHQRRANPNGRQSNVFMARLLKYDCTPAVKKSANSLTENRIFIVFIQAKMNLFGARKAASFPCLVWLCVSV